MMPDPSPAESAWASLACPSCHSSLAAGDGGLRCLGCARSYPVTDGLPDLAPDVPDPRAPEGGGAFRRWLHRRAWQPAVRRWTGIDEAVEAGFLARHVRPAGPLVVELGCGLGREARVLAGLLGPGRVVALDLSRAALLATRADSVGHGVAFVRADAARLPFADGSVGAVNTFGMLHHVPDPTAVVAEVGRVLAPGGTFSGQVAVSPLPGLGTWSAGGLARACRASGLEATVHEGGRGILMFAWRRPA